MLRTSHKVLLGGVVFVLALAGTVALVHGPRSTPEPTGRVVFKDDFERAEIGDQYLQAEPDLNWKAGTWKIEAGRLVGQDIHNAGLWLQVPLPEKVRVDVDVRPETEVGDIKVEIFGDGRTHQSGYIAIMGGWKNTVNCLARRDEHSEERKSDARCGPGNRCVEPEMEYHWTFIRTDNVVKWYVDGRLFLVYDDQHPVLGRHFAFGNWEAKATFDNLEIRDLSAN